MRLNAPWQAVMLNCFIKGSREQSETFTSFPPRKAISAVLCVAFNVKMTPRSSGHVGET